MRRMWMMLALLATAGCAPNKLPADAPVSQGTEVHEPQGANAGGVVREEDKAARGGH